jgi:hypothetical protein
MAAVSLTIGTTNVLRRPPDPIAASPPSVPGDASSHRLPSWPLMVLGSVALAALSLLVLPRNVAYDPWSWLIWGRQIIHLDLSTRLAATAVKPLPIFIDTVLALTGPAAPTLWLVVARTATLLALVLAYRLGTRLGGPGAGIAAAVGLAGSNEFLGYLFVQGMSEPMAAAAVLAAVDLYLESRRRWALAALIAAGLLRPEAWPFLFCYLLWIVYPKSWRRRIVGVAVGVATPLVWFVIDWFGSRQFFRSAGAASQQSQGGPLLSRQPGIATIRETWNLASGPVEVLFVAGFVVALVAWRRSGRANPSVLLGLGALGWLAVDAVLAQGRFATGAARYLLPGDALACVVAGLFVADIARRLTRWRPRARESAIAVVVVWALVAAWMVPRGISTGRQVHNGVRNGKEAAQLADALPHAIALAGGRNEVLRCGFVTTQNFQVPLVAWRLRVPLATVGIIAPASGTVLQVGRAPRIPAQVGGNYHYRGTVGPAKGPWTVLTTC